MQHLASVKAAVVKSHCGQGAVQICTNAVLATGVLVVFPLPVLIDRRLMVLGLALNQE